MEVHHLLYVDDEANSRELTAEYLRSRGYHVEVAASAAEALTKLEASEVQFASIIVDYHLENGPMTGADLTRAILEKDHEAYVIVYSGDETQPAATESWSAGAVGYVRRGANDLLLQRVSEQCAKFDEFRSTLSDAQVRASLNHLLADFGMVGRSAPMIEVAKKIKLYKEKLETVLITGESGAGKEKIAQALGDPRKPFKAINCATFKNHDLLESELFGHEKGSFTGADRQKIGLLELAGDGILFLDELHEMSLDSQSKLLRAFQERNFRRMGGTRDIPYNCRLITAAKPDLPQLVKDGLFKKDLFYRMEKLTISVAPLRERRDDVAPLILYSIKKYAKSEGEKMNKIFRSRTVRIMEQYDWPGNVRELDNVVYRLLTHCQGRYVEPSQLPSEFFINNSSAQMTWEQFQKRQHEERREFLLKVCTTSTHKAHAARRLDIHPHAIHALMKTYKITWPHKGVEEDAETVVLE